MTSRAPLVGIFVGGRARRMGGIAKGMLAADARRGADEWAGESIAARLIRLVRARALEVVLVGAGAAYDALDAPRIADATPDAGPLGALVALLDHGEGADVIALACDLPELSPTVIGKLAAPPAPLTLAPRIDGRWQPLTARYASSARDEAARRLARGEGALHALLDAACARELELDAHEQASLIDWDSPADRRAHQLRASR